MHIFVCVRYTHAHTFEHTLNKYEHNKTCCYLYTLSFDVLYILPVRCDSRYSALSVTQAKNDNPPQASELSCGTGTVVPNVYANRKYSTALAAFVDNVPPSTPSPFPRSDTPYREGVPYTIRHSVMCLPCNMNNKATNTGAHTACKLSHVICGLNVPHTELT